MSLRLVVVALVAALSLVACDSTTPTTSPAATGTNGPSVVESAAPSAGVQIDDPPYLAGAAFSVPVNDVGITWNAPVPVPVMPNGQPALRVAFLPTSCATGDFFVQAGVVLPEDPWEASLDISASEHGSMSSWPAQQVPDCGEGQGRTYLEVGYHPLALETIHLAAALRSVTDAPTEVDVVPVYTSADASQPSLTMTSVVGLEPQAGPEKPRKATPQEVVSTTFARALLPDGSAPDHWAFRVTGCDSGGPTFVDITVRIGSAEPVAVGQCSDGSYSIVQASLPLPPEGTPIAVLMAGGTTKSYVQVAEFQWRGDRH